VTIPNGVRPLDRTKTLETLREHLWRYVFEAAAVEDVQPVLTSMFGLRPRDLARLSATHLLLSRETSGLKTAVERLLPGLPSVARLERQELRSAVVGQVDWAATMQRRFQSLDPTVFVCAQPTRRYDTLLARGVREAVQDLAASCRTASLQRTRGHGRDAWNLLMWAGETLRHRKLRDVRDTALSEMDLQVLESRRHGGPIAGFIRLYRSLFIDAKREVVADLVAQRLLAPLESPTLLELLAGFSIAEALERRGFKRLAPTSLLGSRTPLARLRSQHLEVRIFWRTSVWSLGPDGASSGRLARVIKDAGLQHRNLVPDLLLEMRSEHSRRIVIGEVKYTERNAASAEGRGLLDALAYLKDAEAYYADKRWLPHAFVIAWGSSAEPTEGLISVTDLTRVDDLVDLLIPGVA